MLERSGNSGPWETGTKEEMICLDHVKWQSRLEGPVVLVCAHFNGEATGTSWHC